MPGTSYKTCCGCGETKPLDEFYRFVHAKDGRTSRCKICRRVEEIQRRRENPERAREIDRAYRRRNPEKIRERNKRYPEKARARGFLTQMVYQGRIQKPERCEDCGKLTEKHKLHGHHEDYSKPLDVDWLCDPCHRRRHQLEAQAADSEATG
jgi:hypothetical protein